MKQEGNDYIIISNTGELNIERTALNNGEKIDIKIKLGGEESHINLETNAKVSNMICKHGDNEEIWNSGKVVGTKTRYLDYRRIKNENTEKLLLTISDNNFSLVKTITGKKGDIIEHKIVIG